MDIPASFKAAQRRLQDKTIWYRPALTETGSLGTPQRRPGPKWETGYRVNFQTLSDALVAQDWGLVVAKDAQLTASDKLGFALGDYIQYLGQVYKIVGKPHADSHDRYLLQLTQEEAI